MHGQKTFEDENVAVSSLCRWLGVPLSTVDNKAKQPTSQGRFDEGLDLVVQEMIDLWPTFGIPRVWAVLKFRLGRIINRKAVARLMRLKGWTVRQRHLGGRPRIKVPRSVTESPDQRWSTDIAMVFCEKDGWCSFVPVVDCCNSERPHQALNYATPKKCSESSKTVSA